MTKPTKPVKKRDGRLASWRPDKPERKTSYRHPALKSRERGVWYPELVGVVPKYAKTLEEYQKRQEEGRRLAAEGHQSRGGRTGVPDGWGGKARRAKLQILRDKGAAEAKEIVMEMKTQGLIEGEDPRGDEAIEWAVAIIRAKGTDGKSAYTMRDQMEAAKLVAAYCKAKPVARTQTKIETAEDFLGALASKTLIQQ